MLWPVEDYVISFNQRLQKEETQWGVKDQKSCSEGQISERLAWMGEDHKGYNEQGVAMGLGEGTFNDSESNPFSACSSKFATAADKSRKEAEEQVAAEKAK